MNSKQDKKVRYGVPKAGAKSDAHDVGSEALPTRAFMQKYKSVIRDKA